jgi:hypothetical protein
MPYVSEFPWQESYVHTLVASEDIPWLRSVNSGRATPAEDLLTSLPSTDIEREILYERNYNVRSTINEVMHAAIADLRLCPSSTSASAYETLNASSAWVQNMKLENRLVNAGALALVHGKSALGFNVVSQLISVRSPHHARALVEWIEDVPFMHPMKMPASLRALPNMFVTAVSALLHEALKPLRLEHDQPRVGRHLRNFDGRLVTATHGQHEHRRHLIYYPLDGRMEAVPHAHMRYRWS